MNETTTTDQAAGTYALALEVHICDQRRSYRAEFATEDQAIEFIERKRESFNHAFHELEDAPIDRAYTRVLEILYPTCGHGLSEWLCEGPMHYGTGF